MSYFSRTNVNLWNVDDAMKWAEENIVGTDDIPLVKLVTELNSLTNSNRAEAAKQFLAKLQDSLKVHFRLPSSGNVVNNSFVGDKNTVNVINQAEPFACDLSPIPCRNEGSDNEEVATDNAGTEHTTDNDEDSNELHNSFLSDEYHPRRTKIHYYHNIETWPENHSTWMIGNNDIMTDLKGFYEASSHLAEKQGNISDMRLLAIHHIFPFMIKENESITMYLGHHDEIMADLNSLKGGIPTDSTDLTLWCLSLTRTNDNYNTMKQKCFDILTKANAKGDQTDILAANILYNLAPRVVRKRESYMIEDTYVHLYFDSLLEDLFSVDDIFYQSWANSSLESSKTMKPDWMNYIRPWHTKIDITTCEVKPPSKQGTSSDHFDFVKLGLEMRGMLNKMLDIIKVEDAAVFGILVEGYSVKTFTMDMKGSIYRMVQLDSCDMISQQSGLVAFPVVFRCFLQVKNLAVMVAQKLKDAQLISATGKRKLTGSTWRSNEVLESTKQRRTSD